MKTVFIVILIVHTFSLSATTKVTFILKSTPKYTPVSDTLFLCNSLNKWDLSSKEYMFSKYSNGFYELSVELDSLISFEYKINRGNWTKVEGSITGEFITNRIYNPDIDSTTIYLEVLSWQDLHKELFPAVKVTLISVPKNTPYDAKIFIVGSFNAWNQSDPDYVLEKKPDGSYETEIKPGYPSFSYKFTRGSWESVECRWDGGSMSNREFSFQTDDKKQHIIAEIKTWQDLSKGNQWKNLIGFLLIAQLFQLFVIAFVAKRKTYIIVPIVFAILGIFIKLFFSQPYIFNLFPKGLVLSGVFLPGITLFIFMWIQEELYQLKVKLAFLEIIWLLIPFAAIIPLLVMPSLDFRYLVLDNKQDLYLTLVYSYGLIVNLFYSFKISNLIRSNKRKLSWQIIEFSNILKKLWIYISFIVVIGILSTLIFNTDPKFVIDWVEFSIWGSFGIVALLVQWKLFIHYKNKLATYKISKDNRQNSLTFPDKYRYETTDELEKQLIELMTQEKVYKNEKLALADLAKFLNTNTLYVSRLINNRFKMNFPDFVNSFRVKEFIKKVESSENSSSSFLHFSKEVGFNSKSSFNRAFKKYTGKTPSDYFKKL